MRPRNRGSGAAADTRSLQPVVGFHSKWRFDTGPVDAGPVLPPNITRRSRIGSWHSTGRSPGIGYWPGSRRTNPPGDSVKVPGVTTPLARSRPPTTSRPFAVASKHTPGNWRGTGKAIGSVVQDVPFHSWMMESPGKYG